MALSNPKVDKNPTTADHQSADLLVRQHERAACDLGAYVRVDTDPADQVVFSRSAAPGGRGDSEIDVRIVDVSPGGLGLRSNVFVPRGTRLVARVVPAKDELQPTTDELQVRVQRCAMIDRTPAYYLGTAFVAPNPAALARLTQMAKSEGGSRAQQ